MTKLHFNPTLTVLITDCKPIITRRVAYKIRGFVRFDNIAICYWHIYVDLQGRRRMSCKLIFIPSRNEVINYAALIMLLSMYKASLCSN